MRLRAYIALVCLALAALLFGQQQPPPPKAVPPPGFGVRPMPKPVKPEPQPEKPQPVKPDEQPVKPQPAQPQQAEPQKPQQQPEPRPQQQASPAPAAPAQAQQPATLTQTQSGGFVLNLRDAPLTVVIDILARQLHINYILDPRVKGSVTLNTYGEVKQVDIRSLLDVVLRVNGAAIVQVGELYRIVPLADVSRLPLSLRIDQKNIPDNEEMSLNLVFLKYAMVSDLSTLLEKFLGEGATMVTYEPANLLLILDNNRNMRRTMELIALFDSDELARQRVRLFEVKNGRPADIAKELENILKSVSLGQKGTAVRFMPIDRINTIIAVAPNPGVFTEVEKWLKKLDTPAQVPAGSIDNYVYRVRYGRAETLAMAIMQLYLGVYSPYGGYGGFGYEGWGMGYGGAYQGGYGGYPGGYGGAYPGGYGGAYPGGYGGAYPGGYGGAYRGGAGSMGFSPFIKSGGTAPPIQQSGTGTSEGTTTQQGTAATTSPFDLTGTYLGAGYGYGYGALPEGMPRVVPNPMDNSLLIQATPQDYARILKLLRDLDVPPRQVLIEAKIYEVLLTGAFASGVRAFLQRRGNNDLGAPSPPAGLTTDKLQAGISGAGLGLTAGALVGQSRQLLAFLTLQEDNRRAKIISAPNLVATDSIPAHINVGQQVPVLTSQAVTGAQASGSSLFANTIQNRNTGVTLNILAHVNPSGVVTLEINQEVSSPVPPAANAAIPSPSFTTRSVQTQVTVQDGDTVAIGGIIQETDTYSSVGVPVLHRIPVLGMAFGNKSISKERTELIVFMTPRVIYDTNEIADATDELKSKLKRLTRIIKEE